VTVQLVRMTDASIEPKTLPAGTKIIAGYLGGNTPHVWTAAEWNRFKVKKLPIFVCTGEGNGIADGWEALKRLYQLNVPKGTVVAYDMETSIFATTVLNFYEVLRWAGYYTWVYGSRDFVFANPRCSGYWVADYTEVSHLVKGSCATQYENGTATDRSVVSSWQYLRRLRAW
jgi:hypothetical protein